MQRVCFTLRLRPDRIDDYIECHRQVWPDMREALRATGWGNYSLFLTPDGQLIGYLETEDFAAAREAMSRLEVNAHWQAQMAPFFERSGSAPDQQMMPLREIFHLD